MSTQTTGIEVVGVLKAHYDEILTPEALKFVEELEQKFGARRIELLQYRQKPRGNQ
jgi:malate synthase